MAYQQSTTGQVLTSAAMNIVGDSTVNVFDSSTQRNSSISSPSEGMVSYLKDTNAIEYYDGSSWAGIGDIVGVTVTAPLTGGGTTGTVAVGLDQGNASLILHNQVFS